MQNIEYVEQKLEKLLEYRKHGMPARSLSGIFKALRNDSRISMIGDYILMSYIIRTVSDTFPSFLWTRRQFMHALEFCRFWEEEGRAKKYLPKEWRCYVA